MKKILLILLLVSASLTAQNKQVYKILNIYEVQDNGSAILCKTISVDNIITINIPDRTLLIQNDIGDFYLTDMYIIEKISVEGGYIGYHFIGLDLLNKTIHGLLTENTLSIAKERTVHTYFN